MSVKTRQARLTIEELHQVKWLIGVVLALLSLWSLGSLDVSAELFLFLGVLSAGVAMLKPGWLGGLPNYVWRTAGLLMFCVIGIDFVLSIPEFLPPLIRMVILLLIYRMLAPRTRREDLQLILLCLFCLVVSGVLTMSLLFAFQMLLFTPVAMAWLFVLCLLDRGPESVAYQPSWQQFSWAGVLRKVWQVLDLRVLLLGAVLFVFVVLVSTLLFVLTPRFDLHQAIPYLQLGTKALSGFSDEVQLGDVSEIQKDNSIALRVDGPSLEAMPSSPYWRMLVLDKYSKGYFRMSPSLLTKKFRDERNDTRELIGANVSLDRRRGERWTFYLEGGTSKYLPLPGFFHVLRFQELQNVALTPDLYLVNLESVRQSVFFYQIEDLVWTRRFPASEREIEAYSHPSESSDVSERRYPLSALELDLEPADREFLGRLNQELWGGESSLEAVRYSQRLTEYLRRNFRYSLQPNRSPEGADPVVSWLRNGNRGHCELFAAAFVLLARDAGYPARMVVGFAGGSWNPVEEYFVVRNRDAHAWVEIYEAQTREWLRVDPTPGSASSDPDVPVRGGIEFETGWGAWVDSLRIQWYRRIVNFDQNDQIEMASSAKAVWEELTKGLSERMRAVLSELKAWGTRPFSRENLLHAILLAALCLSGFFFWRARYWWIGGLFRLLRRPKKLDPVRRQASRYLRLLKARAAWSGVEGFDAGPCSVLQAKLKALRFGPEVELRHAKPVFVEARRFLRRRGKA